MYHYRLRIIFIITVLRVIFIITVLNYMYHYRLRIIFIIIVNVRPIKRFFKIPPGNEKSKQRNFHPWDAEQFTKPSRRVNC
jgi:hypothetical protein